MENYFYRVTESYYESSDVHIDFYPSDKNALDRAKEHVDNFYKNSDDRYATCCICKVQEEIVEYISLFAYPEYKNLTEDDKKNIILKYLDREKNKN